MLATAVASGLGAGLLLGVGWVWVAVPTGALVGLLGLHRALVRGAGWDRRQLGFTRSRRSLVHLVWQVPAALVAGVLLTVAAAALLGIEPGAEPSDVSGLPREIVAGGAPVSSLLVLLCAVVVVPVVEEVVFRRVLLDWLRGWVHPALAVALSAVAFGVVHVAPPLVLYATVLGLTLGALHLWHRSLWAPVALHVVNNALATAVLVL